MFPLIVAATFARKEKDENKEKEDKDNKDTRQKLERGNI